MGNDDLVLCFETQAQLLDEYARNLGQGRAFVSGTTNLPLFARALLVLEHTATHSCFEIPVEVVMVMAEGPMQGLAVQFLDRSQAALDAIAQFVNQIDESSLLSSAPPRAAYLSEAPAHDCADERLAGEPANEQPLAELSDDALADASTDDAGRAAYRPSPSQARQMKLRDLSVAERYRVARGPNLEDRTLLERIYGHAVWEALLRNPKITVAEVARLARKGTMPRPLLDLIVENDYWIRQSVVRRGLLANPRLSPDGVAKVLRTLSGRELKLVPQQTAYPVQVRTVAQRLMRGT